MIGRVNKGIAGKFTVFRRENNVSYLCAAKGRLKADGEIYIGDIVEFDEKERVVERVFKRKNFLVRPRVSNIDIAVITLAPVPEPDFFLADRIIVNALATDIEPVICVNKTDCDGGGRLAKRVELNYGEAARIVRVSAAEGGVNALLEIIKGKTVCLAGQSAVGKTSIVNAVLKENAGRVGGLSEKLGRGRHTTRHNEIFATADALIIDTAGFSELNIPLMHPSELPGYYADFAEYAEKCRYKGCAHICEDECAVVSAVENGIICRERYSRYKELYGQLNESWKKRYG
ncbi:MAG: ribosome small subunit-dependent GTPase A [Clostridiales bacterium]|jgi:ribosome biogenesis GTPase|nr:ribosome small subunit-dependent GTPase A [Clostridiales bacterium]